MTTEHAEDKERPISFFGKLFSFLVGHPPVPILVLALMIGAGLTFAPFDLGPLNSFADRDKRIAVDAIPNIGQNQQLITTAWPGTAPQDVEDQITYPLTTELSGMPGVITVRGTSMFGLSMVYIIFNDDVDFYWSRARLLEKLASLPSDKLPAGVTPKLGPDATPLGQVLWYTLENHGPDSAPDNDGAPANGSAPTNDSTLGGWDLHELRRVNDWQIRDALAAVPGVAEVVSIGGHVEEYQVDIDSGALVAHNITITDVSSAIASANGDVGARTLEINGAEYVLRGSGRIRDKKDIQNATIKTHSKTHNKIPLRVKDIARVSLGPAQRRGILDDAGAEVVGGVVITRYGANPMEVLRRVKAKIAAISPGLPSRTINGKKTKLRIVPFYDRTELIDETLDTLSSTLKLQLLIAILVVFMMLRSMRAASIIAIILPAGVLATFAAMKLFDVEANIMALGGIAIAIGTMVDMGILFTESISQRLSLARKETLTRSVVVAASEIAPAVLTSMMTTVVSFIPVFGFTASEGKLFTPLAWTKTLAMVCAYIVAILVIGGAARFVFRKNDLRKKTTAKMRAASFYFLLAGVVLGLVTVASWWQPLGPQARLLNIVCTLGVAGVSAVGFYVFFQNYETLLRWALDHTKKFLLIPLVLFSLATLIFFGVPQAQKIQHDANFITQYLRKTFPGLSSEFMPSFDEGAFLVMPITAPHASIGTVKRLLSQLDRRIAAIPEVDRVVGKAGRIDSALDPAPISMFETLVTYKKEFRTDADGNLIRQWRDHIRSPDDIWQEIARASNVLGLTPSSKLMPIETRLIMLESGLRTRTGLRVNGTDAASAQKLASKLEQLLKNVEGIEAQSVQMEHLQSKPYLVFEVDRERAERYGISVNDAQQAFVKSVGGDKATTLLDGTQRIDVNVRYARRLRDSINALESVWIKSPVSGMIKLKEIGTIRFQKGPQAIKSENARYVNHIIFNKSDDHLADITVVKRARQTIDDALKSGDLILPAGSTTPEFIGEFKNELRSKQYLLRIVPVSLIVIFLLLYLQFRRLSTVLIVFSSMGLALSGALILVWLYGRPGFLTLPFGESADALRTLLNVGPVKLSLAVWVGIIAVFGLATDDSVVMATYLDGVFGDNKPQSTDTIHDCTIEAAKRRLRPCLMTTATTLLALLPVITARGRGADVMMPMALPILGGTLCLLFSVLSVPVLYAAAAKMRLRSALALENPTR